MTLTEAAKFYTENKKAHDQLSRGMKEAEETLKDWFEANGKTKRGRIGFSMTITKGLDTAAVREHLGADVVKFELPRPRRSLFLMD